MKRHEGMEWEKVLTRLEARPEKLWSLRQMEINGHEPDVVDYIETTGEYVFLTTSGLNNAGHTSLVYDKETEDCVKERQAYDETSIIEMVKRDRTGWPVEAIERAIEENGAFQKSSCYVKRNVVDLAAEMGVEIPEPALFCKIVEKRDLDPRDTWVKILVDNKWVGAKMAAARSNFKDGKFTGRIEANYVVGKFGGALKAQSFRGVLKV